MYVLILKKTYTLILVLFTIALTSLTACKKNKSVALKIMSYNIRHGKGMDTKLDLLRSVRIIKSQTPDYCALQEIDNFCTRSDSVNQTAYLAEETQMNGTFGKFMNFQKGEYGMATLSKKPIISTKILQLPDGKYEPRSSIVQELLITENLTIIIANVHFDWIANEEGISNRLKQANELVQYLNILKQPCIIIGDFNCKLDSPTMQFFAEQGFVFVNKGADNLSFQGETKAEIDHVIFRNTKKITFNTKSILLLNEPIVSDHRPLVTELEITTN